MANSTVYALNAAIFSADRARANRVATKVGLILNTCTHAVQPDSGKCAGGVWHEQRQRLGRKPPDPVPALRRR